MAEDRTDVLIAGAGPTGLVLAIVLAKLGAKVRVVDAAAEAGKTSRALAVQARTLEFYRMLGFADEAVKRGLVLEAANLWRRGEKAAHIDVRALGEGASPYPFALIFPQDEHEALLVERLAREGVEVERSTELVSLIERDGAVIATLESKTGRSDVEAKYVAGCDGAHSATRGAIHVAFPGGTYEHMFYVADIEGAGAILDGELHLMLDDAGFFALFPLAGGRARIIGTVEEAAVAAKKNFGWEDVERRPITSAGLEVKKVNWFSTYRVHHRVADSFRRGRVFLLGDAAHIHSPVGGQGMNTGIGDAMNLGWKLAAVLARRANHELLDTYEPERIAFARRLVATTDRMFQAVSSSSKLATFTRTEIVPPLLARLIRTEALRRVFFKVLSQIGITYKDVSWSDGHGGHVHAGDRLPWIAARDGSDNFEPLKSFDWQVHLYGAAPSPELAGLCETHRLALHAFGANERLGADHLYLVRPDGYLGLVAPLADGPARLDIYLGVHGIAAK